MSGRGADICSKGLSLQFNDNESGQMSTVGTRILHAKPLLDSTASTKAAEGTGTTTSVSAMPHIPSISASAVLGESSELPPNMIPCRGHDFSNQNCIDDIINSMLTTGFQATNLGLAVQQIRRMREWRLSDEPIVATTDDDDVLSNPNIAKRIRARIFLGYTSNQISSGQREVIKFLVQHGMVDVIVTTAGGIEEDLIKCFHSTYLGDFRLSGRELRKQGINRIGNLLVPNKNYCDFEDWITPLISKMHDEQDEAWIHWSQQMVAWAQGTHDETEPPPQKFVWTPSKVIQRLGLEMDHDDSVLTWAARNSIPVFCPALTDGSIGDMLYFHSYKRAGFVLDIAEDIRKINDLAVPIACHRHDFFINTGQEFDGSDSGASPDEAISWGKIRINAKPVKVCADATVVFPLIVSQTFAKNVEEWKESVKDTVCWVDDLDLNGDS
ncbi:Deoxyhypusine synthase [Fragilaria crotonensis]|nr:Deoxyhypusine synthase [Fragilaria crotonensis]